MKRVKPQDSVKELAEVCQELIDAYVANLGHPEDEFISCITPRHASEMSPAERRDDKYWGIWDRARKAICEAKPLLKETYWPTDAK